MFPLRKVVPQVARRGRLSLCETTKVFASSLPLNTPLDLVQEPNPLKAQGFQITRLDNGLSVATIDSCSPVSRIGIILDAGSRYETSKTAGITHFLRAGAFASNMVRTAFSITREVEHNGATLETTSTREHLIMSADCLRDKGDVIVKTFGSALLNAVFFPWEVETIAEQVKLENAIAETQQQVGVLETLHKLAYRNALGNSLYCLPSRIGAINGEMMRSYVDDVYVGNRMALIGVGVNHEELVELANAAQLHEIPAGSPVQKEPAKYHGGELHKETGGVLAHAALVSEGAGLQGGDFAAVSVLQRLLGTTPYVKWGSNVATSRLNLAVTEVTDGPFAVSSFNASYSDSGLFGFYLISEGLYMRPALRSCVAVIKNLANGNISDVELERAKNQTKAHILMNAETRSALFEDIAVQVMTTNGYTAAEECCSVIDKVTGDDLARVAQKIYKGKPTLSAAGNMSNTPHIDELF